MTKLLNIPPIKIVSSFSKVVKMPKMWETENKILWRSEIDTWNHEIPVLRARLLNELEARTIADALT